MEAFKAHGADVKALKPSNSGFAVAWSDIFRDKFAGEPLKSAYFTHAGLEAAGEAIITRAGIEGGAIYALSAALRDSITADELARKIANAPSGTSTANRLRRAGLTPVAASLLRERRDGPGLPASADELAIAAKACVIPVTGVAPIERAISTAGGVSWDSLNADYSLKADPRTFLAGEMLDWEAPTGGYLLQACFATGRAAAHGMLARIA